MKGPFTAALLVLLTACSSGADSEPLVGTLERDRIEIVAEASEPIVSIEVRAEVSLGDPAPHASDRPDDDHDDREASHRRSSRIDLDPWHPLPPIRDISCRAAMVRRQGEGGTTGR